jgi:hypothetical protein
MREGYQGNRAVHYEHRHPHKRVNDLADSPPARRERSSDLPDLM